MRQKRSLGVKVLKKIVEWPSLKLSKQSNPVFKVDENIKQLSVDLIDTCNVMFGIGLINPQIEVSGEKIEWTESCLSLPGTQGKVTRSQKATVTYLNLDGETKNLVADWPYAGGLQHEIDHLEGILYTKRQERKRSFSTLSRLRRIRRKEMIKQRKLRRERG